MKYLPRLMAVIAGAIWLGALSSAGRDADLKRTDPVPAGEPIPLRDYFRPNALSEPRLNLAGTHLAYIVTQGDDKHQLLVYDFKDEAGDVLTALADKDLYSFVWLGDTRLLYYVGDRKLFGVGLFAVDIDRLREAYPVIQHYGSRLVAVPGKNPQFPLVWNRRDFLEPHSDLGVATVNTNIKTAHFVDLLSSQLTRGAAIDARDMNDRAISVLYPQPESGITYRYLADREGQLEFACTENNGVPKLLRLVDKQWVSCPVNLDEINVLGPGDESGQLLIEGPRADNKPRPLEILNAVTGAVDAVLVQDDTYDFNGWVYRDPVTQRIAGAHLQRNGPRMVWFNESYVRLQALLDKFFPKVMVQLLGGDRTGKNFLVATFSDRQPAIYYVIGVPAHTVRWVRKSAPWIDPERMQPMNIIKFKTRDGRKLDAYVTMPKGASKASPPPLVVLPHGGPWVRDNWGFNGEVQFLASRGYAVLQPNYRGSLGYDSMFPAADRWAFRKMHDDVTDATKALIASGLVDPKRVAIMGGSFGGYLAVSGVEREPGLYRCAVTIAGVFDWAAHIRDRAYDRYDNTNYDIMIRRLGDPTKNADKFAAISVLDGASQIRVPVFVSHGKDDPVVEIAQSRRLIAELEKGHVPHESLLVSEEGHGMHHLDNQVELYSRIEAFLAKNLAAAP